MAEHCQRCTELVGLLSSFEGLQPGRRSGILRKQAPDGFCAKATSAKEVSDLILLHSGAAQYFISPNLWRAGTLRWSAWAIVVSERGVYVQGEPGPVYVANRNRNLAPNSDLEHHSSQLGSHAV